MLSERQLRALLALFEARMQSITDKYLALMGGHLKAIGGLKPSDVHRLTEMRRMGANVRTIQQDIARSAEANVADLAAVFGAVAAGDQEFAQQWFGGPPRIKGAPKNSTAIERVLKAQLRVTAQAFKNLSQTTIQSTAYREAVDVAIQTVQTGVTDYASAIRGALKAAGNGGLSVQYPSGLTRRLDSAVRQNVLDGVRSLNNDILGQLGNEYGADGVELSAHALCAEDHLPYQGRQFSRKAFEQLQASLPRPVGMWNCKHTIFPVVLGVSEPAHTPEELAAYARNSREAVEIDGRVKTRYEWTQEQRRTETAIRRQKDVANLAKASGDDVLRREAQSHINTLQEHYARISAGAGLTQQPERAAVAGFRRMKTAAEVERLGVGEPSRENIFAAGYKPLTGHDFDANIDVDVPKDVRRCVDRASKRVTDDFPLLDDYLYAVGYGKNEPGNPATAELSFENGYVGQVIALNRDMWTSLKQMDAFVRDQSAQGGHIQARHADSIITHEYGHVLHHSCALKRAGYTGQGTISQRQIMRFIVEKDKIAAEVKILLQNAGLTLAGQRAYEEENELIAEAFSDYYSGKRTKAAKLVIDYLRKECQ